jgi:hypothetical protein
VTRQGAGVDRADADDALLGQQVVERPVRAPAAAHPGGIAHDVAVDPHASGLEVLVVDAGVADVRRRHDDDLAAVGGVGQRLLVAGHPGGEDDLGDRRALRAEGLAAERATVLEHEHGGGAGLRAARGAAFVGVGHAWTPSVSSPDRTVGTPRRNVATTRPGSSCPA